MSNQVAVPPLYTLLQELKTETMRDMRVCLPGSISGVDVATGTVSVKIGVMQKIPQAGLPRGLDVYYPELTSCPVFFLQGGGVGAVMPVTIGDECLVVFSDKCIDAWFSTGQPNPLPSVRVHNISDGFVLVGLNSLANKILTPLLANEGGVCETKNAFGAKVAVNSATSLITLQNGTQNLFTALTDLTTSLTALITTLTTLNAAIASESGVIPISAAAAGTANVSLALVQTQITAVQAELAGLLY